MGPPLREGSDARTNSFTASTASCGSIPYWVVRLPGGWPASARGIAMTSVRTFKAVVRNRHLAIDDAVDLPEGTELELTILDDDDPDETERPALHAALDAARASARAGNTRHIDDVMRELDEV